MGAHVLKMKNPQLNSRETRAIQLYNRAVARQRDGKLPEAIADYRAVLELSPRFADALNNLGAALSDVSKYEDAIQCFEKAEKIKPGDVKTLNNHGVALRKMGKPVDALKMFNRAVSIDPKFVVLYANMGQTLEDGGNTDEAIVCYKRGLEIDPKYAELYNSLGIALKRKLKIEESIAVLERAIELRPNYAEAFNNLAHLFKDQGRIEDSADMYRKAAAVNPHAEIRSNLVFNLHYDPRASADEIFAEHKRYAEFHAPAELAKKDHINTPDPARKIRVGYMSPDFRDHSCSFFLEPILANHDKNSIEVYAYAQVANPDKVTDRLKAYCNQWRSILNKTDAEVVEMVLQDKIDILVDLAGHTAHNRLLVFARKPAPIQVNYLGYPNTTGIAAIDYRLSDKWADPPESRSQALCVEELVHLRSGFLCYRPHPDAPEVSPSPAAASGQVTFGSFNVVHKVSERLIEVWSRIMKEATNSHLFLKSSQFASPQIRERYIQMFEKYGVQRTRVHVVAWEESRANHFGLYGEVDIALDPFPYNGTTTTCEAAWMGVPTVVLRGQTHVSRVGGSLLTRLGLPELIAESEDEYVRLAVNLASDTQRLNALRAGLRSRMSASSIRDEARFTRDLERAYRAMWCRWCERVRHEPALASIDERLEKEADIAFPQDARSQHALAPAISAPPAVSSDGQTTTASRTRTAGRVAELALLADAMSKLGQKALAHRYAAQGLALLRGGQHQGGTPQALLNEWQSGSSEALLLKQLLSFSSCSSFYSRKEARDLLMAWAKIEPKNPEPFIRFGLLFALIAADDSRPVPAAAIEALNYASRLADENYRAALALSMLVNRPLEVKLPYDSGTQIYVPPDIRDVNTYIPLEQGDWHEEEIDLYRNLVRAESKVLDLGAGIGFYSLSAAVRARQGLVIAIESDAGHYDLLKKTATAHPNLNVHLCSPHEIHVDNLGGEFGVDQFDLVRMSVEGCEVPALNTGKKTILEGSPVIFYKARDAAGGIRTGLIQEFRSAGFESFVYCGASKSIFHVNERTELDDYLANMIALKPASLARLKGLVSFR